MVICDPSMEFKCFLSDFQDALESIQADTEEERIALARFYAYQQMQLERIHLERLSKSAEGVG